MNYIIFDLEWNQCPRGKEYSVKELPFEIIEIGAVKLNSEGKKIGQFSELIRPEVYKELHFKTREVIHIKMNELKGGRSFREVAKSFLDWCGTDFMFCTWGAMDLYELQRNMKYFNVAHELVNPLMYYDVQKLFSMYYEDNKLRKTLEYAVEFLNIRKFESFHRAVADADYTASVFKRLPKEILNNNYSIDYYSPPKRKKDEIFVYNDEHSKYVSREFNTKEAAMSDREVVSTRCNQCKNTLRKKIRWFSVNAKTYYSVCYCEQHGYVKCKIRMKRTDDGKYFVIKTIKAVSEEEAMEIKLKKEELVKKRREKQKIRKIEEMKLINNKNIDNIG